MSKLKYLFTVFTILFSITAISAQENSLEDKDEQPAKTAQRPNLLRELDLTRDQIREIRSINQSNRQNLRAAQAKVFEARRNLDQAIYSENSNETTVKQRLKEFQEAQAEVAEIRAFTEYSIRKILTPEQLIKFRELRERFEEMKRNRQQNDQMPTRRRNFRRNQINNQKNNR